MRHVLVGNRALIAAYQRALAPYYEARMSPIVRPVRVHEDETVEIQWTCRDGTVFHQRVTIPPKATRDAQQPAVPSEVTE